MNTHIIIPNERPGWSNSEDVLIFYENDVISMGSYSHLLNKWIDYVYGAKPEWKIIKWSYLNKLKQISLDEKDVEEKAEKWATVKQNDKCSAYYNALESYKQALKDLL